MINKVLTILKDELNESLGDNENLGDLVVIEDIAKGDNDTSNIDNKVVITLLSVEEESTLKNSSRYIKTQTVANPTESKITLEKTPAYLNLYVMVSANRNGYTNALTNISKVIEIFQSKNVLTSINPITEEEEFKFRIELHSVPFDQLSYIWGLLGGKVMPSVLYKISVIKIVAKEITDVELINKINVESIKIN